MKEIRIRPESLLPQLKKVHLFRYLSEAAVHRMLECSTFEDYEDGEYFIHEHQMESKVYVILEGTCAVMVKQAEKESYVAALGAGQVVGEAAIFAKQARTASVVAQGPCRLMCFERGEFLKTLRDEPESGLRILYVMVHNLLGKLREVNLELAFERRDYGDQTDVDSLVDELLKG